MKLRAIIFGATGMVGEGVLHEALHHSSVDAVLVIGRKSSKLHHPKLAELIHRDFYDYSGIESQLRGYNACFFCLGVSSIGMDEQEYTRITYNLTMRAATTLARLNPEMTFCYVSGMGTDGTERGRRMWARVKGKTENHLAALPCRAVYLFRPGFIKPIRGLRNAYTLSRILGVIYPVWKALIPGAVCTLEDLGLAMIEAACSGYSRKILENADISLIARTARESAG